MGCTCSAADDGQQPAATAPKPPPRRQNALNISTDSIDEFSSSMEEDKLKRARLYEDNPIAPQSSPECDQLSHSDPPTPVSSRRPIIPLDSADELNPLEESENLKPVEVLMSQSPAPFPRKSSLKKLDSPKSISPTHSKLEKRVSFSNAADNQAPKPNVSPATVSMSPPTFALPSRGSMLLRRGEQTAESNDPRANNPCYQTIVARRKPSHPSAAKSAQDGSVPLPPPPPGTQSPALADLDIYRLGSTISAGVQSPTPSSGAPSTVGVRRWNTNSTDSQSMTQAQRMEGGDRGALSGSRQSLLSTSTHSSIISNGSLLKSGSDMGRSARGRGNARPNGEGDSESPRAIHAVSSLSFVGSGHVDSDPIFGAMAASPMEEHLQHSSTVESSLPSQSPPSHSPPSQSPPSQGLPSNSPSHSYTDRAPRPVPPTTVMGSLPPPPLPNPALVSPEQMQLVHDLQDGGGEPPALPGQQYEVAQE